MCIKAAREDPHMLQDIPHQYKTQEMCNKVVRDDSLSLQHVPDWFVTQGQGKIWHNDDFNDDDDND